MSHETCECETNECDCTDENPRPRKWEAPGPGLPIIGITVAALAGIGALVYFLTRPAQAGPYKADCSQYDTSAQPEDAEKSGLKLIEIHSGVRIYEDQSTQTYAVGLCGRGYGGMRKLAECRAIIDQVCVTGCNRYGDKDTVAVTAPASSTGRCIT